MTTVTPWEVEGKVDYDKLMRDFGIQKLDTKILKRIEKITGKLHFMLRRGTFFAHRDLNWILDEYEKGNKLFLYTGRSPSGPIHLGHLLPWIFTKWLQEKFDVELWFQFPNEEKVLFKNNLDFDKGDKWMYENMLDIIALGFDPKKTHFIVDTYHADIMYKEACMVSKKITFSMVKSAFGFNESTNIGQIFYTTMQAVPAFLPSVIKNKNIPCLIPHAVDQDVHFRLTRDILPKLGYYKPASIQCFFLPPLTKGEGKMSSSDLSNAIYTIDSPKEVEKKIKKYAFSGGMSTIEEHRKLGGNPDIDIPFLYLKMLLEEDDTKLKKIEEDYRSGKLLSGELKQICIDKINDFLVEHQKKRKDAKKMIDKFIYKPEKKKLYENL